ncbi:DUF3949 domain-containing protein [Paraliobacillus sediminis]|uniref:DUF3949 domain-containing protein n=1 Tax=Paraliobacillus sediminis TaxID=1885916 RepID=UPI000E3C0E05|nr:DUF3949 domain-containing protein [Paraliobacillus sediminis]
MFLINFLLIILGIYVVFSLLITPIQYNYYLAIKEMEDKQKKQGKSQPEMYEEMSFQEDYLHYNVQSNAFFWLPNIFAAIYYRITHPKQE